MAKFQGFNDKGFIDKQQINEKGLLGYEEKPYTPAQIDSGILDLPGRPGDSHVNINKQKQLEEERFRKSNQKKGGGCCFIFLEANNGYLDIVARRYRDEHMTLRNQRGYYKLSEVLVPLMRKSRIVKFLVRTAMTRPMILAGKYFYGYGGIGWLFVPLAYWWVNLFDYLGQDHEFIRENGEKL